MNLDQMMSIAKTAERGKLDGIFFADGLGVHNMDYPEMFKAIIPPTRPAVFEPVTLLTALAQHTRHIGLISTANTTYEEPFLLARKFAPLDHLSNGRTGWNLVPGSDPEDAQNFSKEAHLARHTRSPRAMDAVEVAKGQGDSG